MAINFLNNPKVGDNVKIEIGTGSDLQIYHDGSNSFITNSTGDLTISNTGDDLILKSADDFLLYVQGSELAIQAVGNAGVILRHNNVVKFETTTEGVAVTGGITATDNSYQMLLVDTSTSNRGEISVEDAAFGFYADREAATEDSSFFWSIDNLNKMEINLLSGSGEGQLRLNDYGSGNITGTTEFILGVDSNGNVIETSAGGSGTVTGTGAATRVAFWSSTTALSSDANLYWDNTNDRLGIGTTAPSSKLEVNSDSNTQALTLRVSYTNDSSQRAAILWKDSSNITGSIDTRYNGTSVDMYFGSLYNSAYNTTTRMVLTGSGNLGIGTTAPGAKLDVIGETRISYAPSNQYRVRITNSDGNGRILVDGDTSSLIFGTSGSGANATATERMRITSTGNVGIGETTPLVPLHISKDSASGENIALLLDNNNTTAGNKISVLFRSAVGSTNTDFQIQGIANTANNMDLTFLSDNQVERMRITSAGNVGIGTTSPSALLEVAGSALLQKSFYQTMPNSGGTANRGGYIARPKGGDFISSVNTQTGSLEIQIPTGGSGRDDMVKFVIDIYEYSTNRSLTVFVGGYIYQGIGGTTWTNGSAQVIGSTAADNYTVRFGDNDNVHCVWIGETTETWSYPQVIVRDFYGGYVTDVTEYLADWDIDFVSEQTNVAITLTNNFPLSSGGASGAFLPLAGGTMDSGAKISFDANNALGVSFFKSGGSLNLIIDSNNNTTTANFIIEKDTQTAGSGTELFRVQENGNVGIGTTNPVVSLQAGDGSTGTDNAIRAHHSDATYTEIRGYGLITNRGVAYIRPASDKNATLAVGNDANTWNSISLNSNTVSFNTDTSEHMRITSAGNVGIGTTSPASPLHVVANDVTIAQFASSGSLANDKLFQIQSGGDRVILDFKTNSTGAAAALAFESGNVERMRIDSVGNVGIGLTPASTVLLDLKESDSSADLIIGLTAGTGARAQIRSEAQANNTTSELSFYTTASSSTSERLRITSAGNVGIGLTNPATPLNVQGIIRSNGNTSSADFYSTGNDALIVNNGNANLRFWNNGSERMRITSAGDVRLNSDSATATGTRQIQFWRAGNERGSLRFDFSNSTTSLQADGAMQFLTAGENVRMSITSAGTTSFSGNVGIQTSAPTGDLSVGSTTTSSGDIHLRTSKTAVTLTPSNTAAGGFAIDTGWVSGGQGPITFSLGGSEKMRITSAGEVLIGRTGASGLGILNVEGGADFTGGNVLLCRDTGNVGIGTTSPGATLDVGLPTGVGGTAGSVNRLHIAPFSNTGGPYKFIARTVSGSSDFLDMYYGSNHIISYSLNGDVGIGTTAPGAKLEINDGSTQTELRISVTGDTGYSTINFADASDINPGQIYYHHQLNVMNFRTNDNNRMTIDSTGEVKINKSIHLGSDSGVITPAQSQMLIEATAGNTTQIKMYTHGSSVFNVSSDGTTATLGWGSGANREVNFTNTGAGALFMGVNTGAPVANLHVASGGEAFRIESTSATGSPYMTFFQTTTRRSYIQHVDSGDNLSFASEYGGIVFYTGTGGTETQKMVIQSNGTVGIGTTNPVNPLQVTGKIYSSTDIQAASQVQAATYRWSATTTPLEQSGALTSAVPVNPPEGTVDGYIEIKVGTVVYLIPLYEKET